MEKKNIDAVESLAKNFLSRWKHIILSGEEIPANSDLFASIKNDAYEVVGEMEEHGDDEAIEWGLRFLKGMGNTSAAVHAALEILRLEESDPSDS